MDDKNSAPAPEEGGNVPVSAPESTSAPVSDPVTPPAGNKAAAARAGLPLWVPALLVVNLLAVAGVGWLALDAGKQLTAQRDDLARRLESGDTVAKEARALARQAQENPGALQSRVGVLDAKVENTEGQAAALQALYAEFSRSRDDRVLAEVEVALNGAAQQLQLASNVEAAMIALQAVDKRLVQLDRPLFLPLRQALARDMEALRNAPQLDVSGIAARLEALTVSVDGLPPAFAGEAAGNVRLPQLPEGPVEEPSPLGFVRELGRELAQELGKLVRIERLDGPTPLLLAPEQIALLKEGLKVRLLTARLALLSRDAGSYRNDVEQAHQMLARYFDTRAEAVSGFSRELQRLASVQFPSGRPAIVDSLSALGSLQNRQVTPSAEGPASGAAPTLLEAPVAVPAEPGGQAAEPTNR